ncbi:MAG: lactate utilization protein [Syntrophaceae bacterium]
MASDTRGRILDALRTATRRPPAPRPVLPEPPELTLDRPQMIARFEGELSAQTGVVLRAADEGEVLRHLTATAHAENLATVMASTDSALAPLDLKAWGQANAVRVHTAADFADRETFRAACFGAQAGITGADFAIAETGTLGIIFHTDQPRLISIAPPVHIAVVPIERLVATYEQAIDQVFRDKSSPPSQFCFITGPSASADIQATAFKGMHGPRKLIVILVG